MNDRPDRSSIAARGDDGHHYHHHRNHRDTFDDGDSGSDLDDMTEQRPPSSADGSVRIPTEAFHGTTPPIIYSGTGTSIPPPPPSFSNPALYSKPFLAYSPTIKFTFYSASTDLRQAWTLEALQASTTTGDGDDKNSLFRSNDPWWLDINAPSTDDLHHLASLFGIHPLSVEDVQMRDSREKCEIFERYLFVCLRTCDQRFLDSPLPETDAIRRRSSILGGATPTPASLYILVFGNFIVSVHHEPLPHIRRALRRLYSLKLPSNIQRSATTTSGSDGSSVTISPSTFAMTGDWVMYSLLDDAVDEFSPHMSRLQMEVDTIDDLVLFLTQTEQSDMLKRIGKARKQVTTLLRLLKPKLDIIRVLTKRCQEYLRPHTLLYLRDVNDHVLTNLQNLEQYGETLNRSHSNYLAQISIELNEASNRMNIVMKKLTIAAALLLPLSIISGLWGMNVPVPGQEGVEGWEPLMPFFGIILIMFAVVGLMYALGRYLEWW